MDCHPPLLDSTNNLIKIYFDSRSISCFNFCTRESVFLKIDERIIRFRISEYASFSLTKDDEILLTNKFSLDFNNHYLPGRIEPRYAMITM